MNEATSSPRPRRTPPRLVPMLYFGLAHASLGAAFAVTAFDPDSLVGFFYHPRMLAVVHLVTLGWISGSIFGALYLIGPMALRTAMPAGRRDLWVFAVFFFAMTGVPSHFWIEEYSGVALSALAVLAVLAQVGGKMLRALRRAPVPWEVRLCFALAFTNGALAMFSGGLFAADRWRPFLPGAALDRAYAHAHLATLGWGVLMVFAAGYRLLPMLLPAAMPRGPGVVASAVLLEVGVLGTFGAFLARSAWLGVFAACSVAGIAAFFAQVLWMLRHRRPPARGLLRPDFGVLQVFSALICLAVAGALGLVLAFSPETTETTLRLTVVYGVFGLVGFLSQMVVGVSARLLPLFSWLGTFAASGYREPPPSPHALPARRLQAAALVLWTVGVPLLAAGFYLERPGWVGAAGWILLAAVLVGGCSHGVVLWPLVRAVAGGSR